MGYTGGGEVGGRISYVTQTPWIFTETLKQNILFTEPENPELYKKVEIS